jgi:hypothetical protein
MTKALAKTPEAKLAYHQDQMIACERAFVEHAYECGLLLNEQKKKLSHGEWEPWLKKHWRQSERTARDYMRIANELNRTSVIECETITEAKKLLPPASPKSAIVADLKEESSRKQPFLEPTSTESPLSVQAEPCQSGEADSVVDEPEEATFETDLPKPKAGTEKVSPAKIIDEIYKAHFPALVRGLDRAADAIGERGFNYQTANDALNVFSAHVKLMREGKA